MKTARVYNFKFDADLEPMDEKKHDVEYKESEKQLSCHMVVKEGENSFQAASIAFNQSWRELCWNIDKVRYKLTKICNVSCEEKKFEMNLWLGAALEAQMPETIDDLMTCWKSVNPEKNRNVVPKDR